MTHKSPEPHHTGAYRRHLPLVIILIVAITGALFFRDWINLETLRNNRRDLIAYRDAHYLSLAFAFFGAYMLIVACSLPGATIASITGGFLFGLNMGTVLNVLAASLGACVIFQAARMGLGSVLATKIDASEGTLKRFINGLHNNEISVLFLMRLVPLIPFFVANVLPALVGVRFVNYAITTVLGIIPGALVYTSIGVGLNEFFDRGEIPNLSVLGESYIIGPIVGLCVLALLPVVVRTWFAKRTFDAPN